MNKWIAISGLDGTGKTTLCRYINRLIKRSKFIKIPYFDWVRDMLKISGKGIANKDWYTDALIFATSNRLEMYYIKRYLKEYDLLITQRCWLDFFPYHISRNLTETKIVDLLRVKELLQPDILFFLKCDYKTAYSRIKKYKGDKWEKKELMRLHEQYYEKMMNDLKAHKFIIDLPNTHIIELDSSKPLSILKREVKASLEQSGLISQGRK